MSETPRVPRFQLQKIYTDGSREAPELHALNGINAACRMGRRGFLLTSAIGAGALAALTLGCDATPEKKAAPEKASPEKAPDLSRVSAQSVDGVAAHWPDSIYTLAFSPDSAFLVSGSGDKRVKLWSVPDGKLLRSLTDGSAVPRLAAFSPGDKTLMLLEYGGDLTFWKTPYSASSRQLVKITSADDSNPAFSPDGKLLATGWNRYREMLKKGGFAPEVNLLILRALPDGKEVLRLTREKETSKLVFSPDGTMLLLTERGTPTNFELLSVPSGKRIAGWSGGGVIMPSSPDAALLAIRSEDAIAFRSLPGGEPSATPPVRLQSNRGSAVFSPGGKWLASVADNYDIVLLPNPFDKPALALKGHASSVTLAFSPDGRYLASASDDGVMYIWELQDKVPGARFHAALFDPDATWSGTSFAQGALSGQGSYTGPCGSPLPVGAVCTCNCVSGTTRNKPQRASGGGGGFCQCNTICTCVPVK